MSTPDQPAATLPYSLLSTEQIRDLEAFALSQGLARGELMARAGEALYAAARRLRPDSSGPWWIICGSGNNGGDGYVLARLARAAGVTVRLFACAPPRQGSDAEQACQRWLQSGGDVELAWPAADHAPDLVVDALLGIGQCSAPRPAVAAWIDAINQLAAPVLAVDIPSGLLADSGAAPGAVVRASATLSLLALTPGLFTGRGPDVCGAVWHHPLASLPASPDVLLAQRLDYAAICNLLPRRPRTAHKGTCGRVLIIGGAPGMSGAVRLAGEGALRAGAGLVRVLTHPQHASLLNIGCPELMVSSSDQAPTAPDWPSIRVLGPGLGQTSWSESLWQMQLTVPGVLLLDADALSWLARQPQHRDNWVLTPHPGEAARLLGCSVAELEADRLASVRALQRRYGGVVVLKGAGSLIFDGQQLWLCTEGNPGMASGGMGDLLSGIIAALYAQGLPLATACCVGVCIHGEAADLAACAGERGLLASDLLPLIRRLVNPQDTMNHVSIPD